MELLLAVDIGTGGARAAIYNPGLECKSMIEKKYSTNYPRPGWAEQDAEEIYQAVIQAIMGALEAVPTDVKAISYLTFDCSVHTLLGLDAKYNPLTPVLTWEDSRSQEIIQAWQEEGRGAELYQKTGCPLHPLYAPGKIRWWKEEKPELFHKISYFVTLKAFLIKRLTGELKEEPATTSGSGLINIHQLDWEDEALALAGISRDKLPVMVEPSYLIQGIKEEISHKTGLKKDLTVVIGSSDAGMSSLGSGTVDAEQMTIMIGTSGAVRRIINKPKLDPEARTFCYYMGHDTWFAGGAINNGGIVLKWYRDNFGQWAELEAEKEGVSAYTVLDRCARQAAPGAENLLFLPLLAGERSPYWQGNMRGVISGISLHHNQSTFIRALMEGVAFRILSVYQPLNQLIEPPQEIRVTGGFTHSSFWVQILADVLGQRLSVTREPEGSIMGAAAFAYYSLGILPSLAKLKELNAVDEVVEPRQDLHEDYNECYQKSMRIYHKLKDEF